MLNKLFVLKPLWNSAKILYSLERMTDMKFFQARLKDKSNEDSRRDYV